jgi:ABC-type multidrug transport system ATPase subunit
MTMIRVVDVTHHYGVRPVLKQVNLDFSSGELVAVLGPNGMGKTTLLGVIGGVLWPVKGYVEIDGRRRRASEADELAIRRRVAYLPDHPWLPGIRTGREFLLAVGRLYEIDDDRLMGHVDRLLRVFDLDGEWPIQGFSNGQQKKIAICATLVTEAPVMIMDEPFSGGLDPSGILALKRILQHLIAERKTTVIMSTPVAELVDELAQRIVVLCDGRVAAFDTAEGLRRLTGCAGPLAEVLERLVSPHTADNLRQYFEGEASTARNRERS